MAYRIASVPMSLTNDLVDMGYQCDTTSRIWYLFSHPATDHHRGRTRCVDLSLRAHGAITEM